jgi:hypothetical protein
MRPLIRRSMNSTLAVRVGKRGRKRRAIYPPEHRMVTKRTIRLFACKAQSQIFVTLRAVRLPRALLRRRLKSIRSVARCRPAVAAGSITNTAESRPAPLQVCIRAEGDRVGYRLFPPVTNSFRSNRRRRFRRHHLAGSTLSGISRNRRESIEAPLT